MLCSTTECTGCGCCSAICPKECIAMITLADGIRYPQIDNEVCIHCGLCEKSCPVLSNSDVKNEIIPEVYMCQHPDREVLRQSASGGAFSILADYIFEHQGVVFGAVWEDDFSVTFHKARNRAELKKMQSSKYVQSYLEKDVYKDIETHLKKGDYVLFCGLPCQCAGIRSFLQKDYERFINVDIVCHGVAPDDYLKKHINTLNKNSSQIKEINHTSKRKNWSILIQRTIHYKREDDSNEYIDRTQDFYLNSFLNHLFFNETCYNCLFASMPRQTDFTIGDFFGLGVLEKVKKLDNFGISMIMVNNLKAKKLVPMLSRYGFFEKRKLKEALYFNHNLWKPSKRNSATQQFRKEYLQNEWDFLYTKYHTKNTKQKINVWIRKAAKKILGAKNICYLMYLFYKKNGTIAQVDNIIENLEKAENYNEE